MDLMGWGATKGVPVRGAGFRMGCGTLSGQKYAAVFATSVCCSRGSSRMGIFCVTASKDFGWGFVDPVLL